MAAENNTGETMQNFPRRVLIIDDDPILRVVLQQFFNEHGSIAVDQAENGQTAQEAIGRASEPYDLTTLDLSMPGVDGFEFLTYLKQHNVEMRVLIISSLPAPVIRMAEALADFKALNAIGHLRKPVSATALHAILNGQVWQPHDESRPLLQANA
ncbi:response regulator [Anderseniella sp. Alg231-50]|uniref:response regulator n=1 Tax=Anderseniella sp. Alg231-50 TaxID=1922226 RepID=UPI000D55D5B8